MVYVAHQAGPAALFPSDTPRLTLIAPSELVPPQSQSQGCRVWL
jgi:hypothetical protein